MKRIVTLLLLVLGFCLFGAPHAEAKAKVNKATATHHTIKAAARPFKALGHAAKQTVVGVGTFSISAFDTAVIDPLGVALQAFADGVDMFVAAPLESLPEPFEAVGDGVHYVYLGIDKVGQVLAR